MEEKKILDFTMEHGENISVFMLNEDGDEPTLLFIEKSMCFYNSWTSSEAHDILSALFTKDNYVIRFNYISKDACEYLTSKEMIDSLTDTQKVMLFDRIVEYLHKLDEELKRLKREVI